MRLNRNKFRQMMDERRISPKEIRLRTGLSERTFNWIMTNGFVELCTLECLADAVGCEMGEITAPEISGSDENVIEFTRDADRATVTLSQGRYITRIKKLAVEHPEECRIIAQNSDGSIYAHIPVKWIRINPGMELTEEQKQKKADALRRNIFQSGSSRRENSKSGV